MKKLGKIQAGILGTTLITSPILNTSCLMQPISSTTNTLQRHKEPTVKAQDYEFLHEVIGDQNGFTYLKVDDTLIFYKDETNVSNYLTDKFEIYASNMISQINDSITDEGTKNYLKKCYHIIETKKPCRNIDGALTAIDNSCIYIFNDLIKSLPDRNDRIKFYSYYRIISSEIYKRSFAYPGWRISSYYNEIKQESIKNLVSCNIEKQIIANDIENNCIKIVAEYQNLLAKATTNLNQNQNLQFTTEQIKKLNSMLFSMKCLENIHDSLSSHIVCGNKSTLQLEPNLKAIANKAKNTENEIAY